MFDFIFGDIVEAQFARDSYKFDSANEHFLTVTGIASLISPLQRGTAIQFMRSMELPYSLREINKGIYTYCSLTEAENYGYCRRASKCNQCAALDICERPLFKSALLKPLATTPIMFDTFSGNRLLFFNDLDMLSRPWYYCLTFRRGVLPCSQRLLRFFYSVSTG